MPTNRKVYDKYCLAHLPLNEADKQFLTEKGLEDQLTLFIFFYEKCSQFHRVQYENNFYLIIGENDLGDFYCIDELTGSVYRLTNLEGQTLKQYLNASIIHMSSVFDILKLVQQHPRELQLALFKQELTKIDSYCLKNELNLWSVFIAEWESGVF